jgi:2-polyprenyl-3-methyl-5-hydroxy-6-metoxy-1,4-benzoquinol methylase
MALPQLNWDFEFLNNNPTLQDDNYGIPKEVKHIRYSIRLIRYWFMYHFLRAETERCGRNLSVCEIGVDVGQMLGFMQAAAQHGGQKVEFETWDAVDCLIRRDILERAGYRNFYEVNLESDAFTLGDAQYDSMILLHVLEHLFEPEKLVNKLVTNLKPGGIMIGGFPSTPQAFAQAREDKIRPGQRQFGHVSVFSPERVRAMAAEAGLEVEFLTGAFFMRKKGFFLENAKWWFRFNLWFGGLFPSWPGELYFLLRKPVK